VALLALVIDDSRVARLKLKRVLIERGFDVIEAGDGIEALELLAGTKPPDLAFVDWNMPRMNGLDFVKSVRRDQNYKNMVLMMVTSETEPRQMVRALHAGANEYLMKPYTAEGLMEKLAQLGVGGSLV
jgi:two-component system, chemotaxis family, chemotaxis protein CheY